MSLDVTRLENPRNRGANVIARCPACAELGADKSCEHLFVADDGRFGCIANAGPAGETHRKRIWELVGNTNIASKPGQVPLPRPKPTLKPAPRIPPLRNLTAGEMEAVARLRGWPSFAGLELLAGRGLLWHGLVWDDDREWPAWIITDSARRNAQARRMDGGLWHGIGDKKAKSLPGSDPSWPIGAADISERSIILLCEGQPDFCAALLVAWWEGMAAQVAPVCLTGAGNPIHVAALSLFTGKRVRIAVHVDAKRQGQEAGERWARQLYGAAAVCVDSFDFAGLTKNDGQAVKDLADFATLLDSENSPAVRVLAGLDSTSHE
jgi:hypothetical protein